MASFLPDMPDISAAFFSSVVAHYKNKQTIPLLLPVHLNIWKNILKSGAILPNNVLNQRLSLRLKRFVIYLSASRACPNKINPDTSRCHPCNSSRLSEQYQQPIAITQWFFPNKPTSRQFCALRGRRRLQHRLCFFLTNKRPQFIHFNCLGICLCNFFLCSA